MLLQKWTAPLVDPKRPRYDGAQFRIADGPLLHLLGARGICGSVACAEGAQPRVRLLSPSISSSPSHSHNLNSLCRSKLLAPEDEFKDFKAVNLAQSFSSFEDLYISVSKILQPASPDILKLPRLRSTGLACSLQYPPGVLRPQNPQPEVWGKRHK